MRTNITYVASSGNSYNLITNGILHKEANYHKWNWEIEGTKLQYGYRVADFSREAAVYETELIFYGSQAQRRRRINALHDDFENDVRNKKTGKLIWGDYYVNCYITESSTEATETDSFTLNTITVYCPYPFWVQDFNVSLPPASITDGGYLDYTFDYLYDYSSPVMGTKYIKSTFPFESDFKMVIYGSVVNPRIVINGYAYILYTTIPSNSYVIINSRDKTVMMYGSDGTKTNIFNFRNKTDSIFKKIQGGNLEIVWNATYGIDLTIYHERSEPRIEVT